MISYKILNEILTVYVHGDFISRTNIGDLVDKDKTQSMDIRWGHE